MTYSASESGRETPAARAAIFIDYEDLFRALDHSVDHREEVSGLISEMVEALRRSLDNDRDTQTAVALAYADFTSLNGYGDAVQQTLYLQGVEPRFVPRSMQANAAEIQLCVDAMDLLHHRRDITTFVLLTGSRSYLPLIQQFRRYGRRVLVAAMEEPRLVGKAPHLEAEWFFHAGDLLSGVSRSGLSARGKRHEGNGVIEVRPSSYRRIVDATLIRSLEIIDDYFGQYEEVYLTPLLRKMSELLDERLYDPKALISDLESHRAVRLEKRQGFPHDYTVLIVDSGHPDVLAIQQQESRRSYDDAEPSAPQSSIYHEEDDDYYEDRFEMTSGPTYGDRTADIDSRGTAVSPDPTTSDESFQDEERA